MKKQTVRRVIAACLAACLVLLLGACGRWSFPAERDSSSTSSAAQSSLRPITDPADSSRQDSQAASSPASDPRRPGTRPGGDGTTDAEGQAALDALRAEMAFYPDAPLAAAWFGEPDLHDARSIAAYLQENFPDILAIAPFLLEIPEENIIGDGPELYCLIPRDEATSVSINLVAWDVDENWENAWPTVNDILYRSEYAEPLFVCVDADPHIGLPNAQVIAVADNGAQVEWYPSFDPDSYALYCPVDEASNPLIFDLAMLAGGYDGGYDTGYGAGDDGWYAPTALGLRDTTWWVDGTGWYMTFGADEVEVYQYPRGSVEHTGVWTMEGEQLYIQVTDDFGNVTEGWFPLKISPSGEQLMMQADPQSGALPDFLGMEGEDAIQLTLIYA